MRFKCCRIVKGGTPHAFELRQIAFEDRLCQFEQREHEFSVLRADSSRLHRPYDTPLPFDDSAAILDVLDGLCAVFVVCGHGAMLRVVPYIRITP